MAQDQSSARNPRGQEPPKDKDSGRQPGLKEQRAAAERQPQSPGEPAEK